MSDENETPTMPGATMPPAARSHLLGNLEKARAAKALKDAERRLEKEAAKAEKREEMRKPGEPSSSEGPSLERVAELEALYPQVSIDVRQIIGNMPKSLNDNYVVDTKELYAFNSHLMALGGGGLYKCRVRDPLNLGQVLMTFRSHINAPPKPPARAADMQWQVPAIPPPGVLPPDPFMPSFVATPPAPQAPTHLPTTPTVTPQDPNVQYPPGALPPLPPQYRSMSPEQQWAFYMAQQAMQQRPGGTYSADQIAMHQNSLLQQEKARLEADRAALQEKFAASQRDTETKLSAMKADLERAREDERKRADRLEMELREAKLRAESDKRDAEHRAEMAALRASIDKITSAPAPAPVVAKENDWAKFSVFLPLIQEWMRGNASRDQAERDRSAENMKLMLASLKKEPGIEGEAMKYMVEVLKAKADEKAAGVEANVMMLGAVTTMMKEMQGEAPPAWVSIAEAAIEGIKQTMVGAAANAAQLPGGGPQRPALPAGNGAAEAQGEVVAPSLDEQRAVQQWSKFKEINEEAAKMAFMAYQSPMMPAEMHTSEWRLLIFNLHMRFDAERLATLVADHLEHERLFGLLPPPFKIVFDQPMQVFEAVLKVLPIGTVDKVYSQKFLDAIVKEITARETERKRVDREEKEGLDEEEIETEGEDADDDEEDEHPDA